MRTYHLIAAAAAAALAATVGMAAETERSFVHDGQTYVYHIVDTGDGQVIAGRQLPSGSPFRLIVRDGRVTGTAGRAPVSFRVRDAQGATGGVTGSSN